MNASVRPLGRVRVAVPHQYEGVFGLLLLGVLLLSTLDETALGPVGRGLSLAGFALLTIVNAGAALGVYIGAAIVFSVHHFSGQGSWVERPDNYALLFLTFYLAFVRPLVRTAGTLEKTALAVALLVITSLGHLSLLGYLEAFHFTWFMRMFGIPLGLFVLLRRARLTLPELNALFVILTGIVIYLAAMTVVEAFGWYHLILPPWIDDPNFNPAWGGYRIGGLLMQPEWNALAISLAMCVLAVRRQSPTLLSNARRMGGLVLCLAAIYLTYTRAAWLGLLAAGIPAFWYASVQRGVTLKRRLLFIGFVLLVAAVTVLFPSHEAESRMSDVGTVYFRLNVWAAGLRMVVHHPLFGVGFGEFASNVGNYEQAGGWIPAIGGGGEFGELAHNTFLSVAAELGVIGLLLYIVTITGVYKAARSAAGAMWGQTGKAWVDAFSIIYFVNVQFVTAHELNTNVMYFGVLGAISGSGLAGTQKLHAAVRRVRG